MPEDLRLPYVDEFFLDANAQGVPPQPGYIIRKPGGDAGHVPCRHQWFPPHGGFGSGMNSLTYGLRVRVEDLKLAIPYILGWPKAIVGANLDRVLPITDPDKFGMVATEVSVRGYEGHSGLIKLEIPEAFGLVDGDSPDGRKWNNKIADGFDITFPIDLRIGKLLPIYRYALLDVKFEHVQYLTYNNDILHGLPERIRFFIWNYIPGIEYVSLDSNTLKWKEGPLAIRNLTVGKGAGFVRATGELKGTWYGVPSDLVEILLQKWLSSDNFPADTPLKPSFWPINGKVNHQVFTVSISNFGKSIDFPAETLLMQPPKTTIRPTPMGFRMYDIEFSLTHRPELWNKFLYWPEGNYYRAKYSPDNIPGNDRDVYRLTNFEEAFRA